MSQVIAVFRSRSETMTFVNLLKSYNISSGIINTPRKANVCCGLSALLKESDLAVAKNLISRRNFFTFAGFFRYGKSNYNGDVVVTPV